jgi:hypothetical protein
MVHRSVLAVSTASRGTAPLRPNLAKGTASMNCSENEQLCRNFDHTPYGTASRRSPVANVNNCSMFLSQHPRIRAATHFRTGKEVAICGMRLPESHTAVKLLGHDGSSKTIGWTQDDERIGRQDVLSGRLRGYYIFNVSRAFSCCGQPKCDERADWDSALQLNLDLAVACKKSGNTVVCRRGK